MDWIRIMNPDGVRNENIAFAFGDECVLHRWTGIVSVAHFEGQILYRVTHPNYNPDTTHNSGTAAPPETLFLADPAMVAQKQWKETHEEEHAAKLREQIRRLLREVQ
jgi:hypothetical protein